MISGFIPNHVPSKADRHTTKVDLCPLHRAQQVEETAHSIWLATPFHRQVLRERHQPNKPNAGRHGRVRTWIAQPGRDKGIQCLPYLRENTSGGCSILLQPIHLRPYFQYRKRFPQMKSLHIFSSCTGPTETQNKTTIWVVDTACIFNIHTCTHT